MGAADVEEPEAAQRSESSVAFRSELAEPPHFGRVSVGGFTVTSNRERLT